MNASICKTNHSDRPSLNAARLLLVIVVTAVGLALASCGQDSPRYKFRTAQEGINCYRQFHKEMRKADNDDMAVIAKDIATWQKLEDSVVAAILRDTAAFKNPHLYPQETVHSLHASIRDEFLNRAMARPRTLQDILTLKLQANRLTHEPKIKEAMKSVSPFFLSLDSVSVYHEDCSHLLDRYQRYLHSVEKRGIHTREGFLSFLREEDRLFRSFATHLYEMDGKSATGITKTTERIYARISKDISNETISREELFLYFTMRTNRRLLTNAQGCLMDIKASRMKTADQRQAYLWMILQPFTVINDFGMAVLTEQQKTAFAQVAKEASSVLPRLAGSSKEEREHIEALPGLMVKMYIASL